MRIRNLALPAALILITTACVAQVGGPAGCHKILCPPPPPIHTPSTVTILLHGAHLAGI